MIQTLMTGGGLFTVKLIGVALFTNQSQWGEFFSSIPITVAMILVVCIPFNSLAWFVSNKRYQSLTNQLSRQFRIGKTTVMPHDCKVDKYARKWGLKSDLKLMLRAMLPYQTRHYRHTWTKQPPFGGF
jgi:hypothetical protein